MQTSAKPSWATRTTCSASSATSGKRPSLTRGAVPRSSSLGQGSMPRAKQTAERHKGRSTSAPHPSPHPQRRADEHAHLPSGCPAARFPLRRIFHFKGIHLSHFHEHFFSLEKLQGYREMERIKVNARDALRPKSLTSCHLCFLSQSILSIFRNMKAGCRHVALHPKYSSSQLRAEPFCP